MLKVRILNFLVLILFFITFGQVSGARIGIIVAIGDYERAGNGYTNLSSARDAVLLDSVLRLNEFDRILILQNEQATKEGITGAIESVSAGLQPGDVVLLHFSCHGILIIDEEGHYAEECLVTWDSPFHLQAGSNYHGENHLSYTELKMMRDKLRYKAGTKGDVIMLFDACHSGGLTRGRDLVRGIATPVMIKGWKGVHFAQRGAKLEASTAQFSDELSPYVAISACKTEQSNRETNDGQHSCGSLSFVFAKTMLSTLSREENYEHLFDRMCEEMFRIHPGQFPVMTGVNTDRKLFGGSFVPPSQSIKLISLSRKTGLFAINAGKLQGISAGTVFETKPLTQTGDAYVPVKFILTGEPGVLTSNVAVQGVLPADFNYRAHYLKVASLGVDVKKLTISLDSLTVNNPGLAQRLKAYFTHDKEIEIASLQSELFLTYNKDKSRVEIHFSSDGSLLNSTVDDPAVLREYLIGFCQYNALRRLSLLNDEYKVACSIRNAGGTAAGNILYAGNNVELCIENLSGSKKSVFVNVFDFMPDGNYRLILEDVQIDGSSSKCVSSQVSEPFGRESVMVISTAYALKLSSLTGVAREAALKSRSGNLNILQEIFGRPVCGKTRGIDPYGEDGYSSIINFTIAPEQNN